MIKELSQIEHFLPAGLTYTSSSAGPLNMRLSFLLVSLTGLSLYLAIHHCQAAGEYFLNMPFLHGGCMDCVS